MGKRSVKENKNIYQISRENAGLTREKAGEAMVFVSDDRIEKIENERTLPRPDEVMAMAKCYRVPKLCNYYCSHECPIGRETVPELEEKELSQIVLEVLSSLHSLDKAKNRLIDITVDGRITEDEYHDFAIIREELRRISMSVDSLQLWLDQNALCF